MKKNRDVKFIIYQSLYIFVVCVVAIKGANLDLQPVIDTQGRQISYISEDSLRKLYDAIRTLRFVDTNFYVIISKEELAKNERLAELYKSMPPIPDLSGMIRLQPGQRITSITEQQEQKIVEQEKEVKSPEIQVGTLDLYQYHNNQVNNKGDVSITVKGVTIPAHSTGSVMLGGESTVSVTAGNVTKTFAVKENRKPKIGIQRIATMNEDTRVTELQRAVCFRVTIEDDFPDQLDVKFSGPMTVKDKGSNTYDITLNAFPTKASFDNFTEGKSAPYSLGFTVSVSDRIAPHKNTAQQSFVFGDW